MTAWRILQQADRQAENTADNKHGNTGGPCQQPLSAAIRDPPAPSPAHLGGLSGVIQKVFRAVAKAIIQDFAPKPKRRKRRKRDEDTRGLFKKLALKILLPAVRSIFHDSAFNRYAPPNELDDTQRRMRRQWNSPNMTHHDPGNQAFRHDRPNHLSLRF